MFLKFLRCPSDFEILLYTLESLKFALCPHIIEIFSHAPLLSFLLFFCICFLLLLFVLVFFLVLSFYCSAGFYSSSSSLFFFLSLMFHFLLNLHFYFIHKREYTRGTKLFIKLYGVDGEYEISMLGFSISLKSGKKCILKISWYTFFVPSCKVVEFLPYWLRKYKNM